MQTEDLTAQFVSVLLTEIKKPEKILTKSRQTEKMLTKKVFKVSSVKSLSLMQKIEPRPDGQPGQKPKLATFVALLISSHLRAMGVLIEQPHPRKTRFGASIRVLKVLLLYRLCTRFF